jgi:cobalt-zinc-cadmium efflux system protein
MAHHQKAVAAAAALNSGIFAVEAVAGYQAGSLALLMDSVHNLSDEMALVFLYLAFILSLGVSRNLLRSANVFNSVGLVAVSALLLWQAIERVLHPMPIDGAVPIIVGLAAAAANWIVARLLLKPARNNAAIRLAYIHNMGFAGPGRRWTVANAYWLHIFRSADRGWRCSLVYRQHRPRSLPIARGTDLA